MHSDQSLLPLNQHLPGIWKIGLDISTAAGAILDLFHGGGQYFQSMAVADGHAATSIEQANLLKFIGESQVGDRALAIDGNGDLIRLNLRSGQRESLLAGVVAAEGWPVQTQFLFSDPYFAITERSGRIKIWDVNMGLLVLDDHEHSPVLSIAISAVSSIVLVKRLDRAPALYNLMTGALVTILDISVSAGNYDLIMLAVPEQTKFLVYSEPSCCVSRQALSLWDAISGTELSELAELNIRADQIIWGTTRKGLRCCSRIRSGSWILAAGN